MTNEQLSIYLRRLCRQLDIAIETAAQALPIEFLEEKQNQFGIPYREVRGHSDLRILMSDIQSDIRKLEGGSHA